MIEIRAMGEDEVEAVIGVWHVTKQVAYPYLPTEQGLTLDFNRRIFREFILPRNAIWVARDGGAIVGFLAIEGSYVDRLYVLPEQQERGVGSALMAKAKALSPAGLRLHTHQQNEQARRFYERQGFRAVKFGVSPPPESAPDVEYQWTPDESAVPAA